MEITFTVEELKKYEAAVKEHIGRKFLHFANCCHAHFDGMTPGTEAARRALESHKKNFEGKFPTISSTLGLD